MSDWWAQKLGRAPASAPSYPQTPQGYPQTYNPAVQQYVPVTVPTVDMAGRPNTPDVMVEDPAVPGGRRLNWRSWGGGEAAKTEHERCPQCGSTNFFHFRNETKFTDRGAATPAPQCFECNYTGGLYRIFGGG